MGLLYRIIGDFFSYIGDIGDTPTPEVGTTGCLKKNCALLGNQNLGTSHLETTHLLGLKLWQQGVLASTPCCQSLRSNRYRK